MKKHLKSWISIRSAPLKSRATFYFLENLRKNSRYKTYDYIYLLNFHKGNFPSVNENEKLGLKCYIMIVKNELQINYTDSRFY